MARKHLLGRLVLLLLATGAVVQFVVPIARIATVYKAMDLGLSSAYVGWLSAAFALLPVFLTLTFGRLNEEGGAGPAALIGAGLVTIAAFLLWLLPTTIIGLFLATSLLGVGQTLLLTALQSLVTRSSTLVHRDAVLGNFLVAVSLGQAISPLIIVAADTNDIAMLSWRLMAVSALASLVLFLLAIGIRIWAPHPFASEHGERISLGRLLRIKGVVWVVTAGTLIVAAQDLLLVFLPVLGIERAIGAEMIGLMLSVRAVSAMASRLLFGRLVQRYGRLQVMLGGTVAAAASMGLLAFSIPIWAMFLTIGAGGFGIGLAIACSLSLAVNIAPPAARATTLSLRITSNRLGQFLVPLSVGMVAAATGVVAVFIVAFAGLFAVILTVPRDLRRPRA